MEIIVGKTSGFCFGVKNAVNKTEEEVKKCKGICCLGELVHNRQVIKKLEKKGVKFINDITEAKNKVIFRAHGAEKRTYEFAQNNNIKVVDLSCPKVLHIHKIVEEYVNKGYYIFLTGQKTHPEVVATESFCGEDYSIIENNEDMEEAISIFNKSKKEKALILSQTTYSLEKFKEIVKKIKQKIPNLEIKNTICNATKERQEETTEIASKVDAMIIIGGKNSSNTSKLYELAEKYCENVQIIETEEELNEKKLEKVEKIGIMAGASTPKESIENVVKKLKQ